MMQSIGRRYVRYINRSYHRTGSLWEGRFKSSLVQVLTCMRYIELNAVRANMVNDPGRPMVKHEQSDRVEDQSDFGF